MTAAPSHIAVLVNLQPVMVVRGKSGWMPMIMVKNLDEADAWIHKEFGARAPTPHEREAARYAAMFGWDRPGASPDYWRQRDAPMPGA